MDTTKFHNIFFFVEKPSLTSGAMSSGVDSIQTCNLLPKIAFMAKKWAIELPMRLR